MTPSAAAKEILELLEATGKPVLVEANPSIAGYATIRMAGEADAAHVLLYRPEFQSELPYLTAFQCGLALRSRRSTPENRFDLASTPCMDAEVQKLVREHLKIKGSQLPEQMVQQLCTQFGRGLGMQLRSMPIAIRVDEWLHESYPSLRELQRESAERQLQEARQALGPSVQAIAPKKIIDANASMSAAFAMFWSGLWSDKTAAVAFVSAGYETAGQELLNICSFIDTSPDFDRSLVDAWAKRLSLDSWFKTIDRT